MDENYYATEEAAEKYVQAIYKFMRTIPKLTHLKTRQIALDEFYGAYKANRRTTWYILFHKKMDTYFIHNLFNNHGPDYPGFVDNLK